MGDDDGGGGTKGIDAGVGTNSNGLVCLRLKRGTRVGEGGGGWKITKQHGQQQQAIGGDDVNGKSGWITFPSLIRYIIPPCCWLNPVLFNGHLQTLWTVLAPWQQAVPVYYGRRIFEQMDPKFEGSFAVDFVVDQFDERVREDKYQDQVRGENQGLRLPPRTRYLTRLEIDGMEAGQEDIRPMLVVLHGLSGGSHELYLRHVIARLLHLRSERRSQPEGDGYQRWEVCVINSRGCANSRITTPVLYNARATWDLRHTVRWLRRTYPNRPLFAIGFSLGANILTNYLGEEGERCEFRAAMMISNPWNLEVGSLALQRSFLGLNLYSRAMGSSMKKLFDRHVDQVSKNPRISLDKVRRVRFLYEFDREVQGPTWGYPTEGAYYRDASSSDSLLAIRIPFFALHATDDPIAVDEALPRQEFEQTPYGLLLTTSLGGHLGWFQLGGGRWFARVAAAFLETMASDVETSGPPHIDSGMHDTAQKRDASLPFEPMRRKMKIAVSEQAGRVSRGIRQP